MLDENLPVFFLKPSTTGIRHHASIHLSHKGSDPEPVYSLTYLDPASNLQAHKNCYAAALFDAYIPDVLYGEVMAHPTWTQPTLSAEEIRRHGGIPPPPEARVPQSFNIQLYNPDQQVAVHLKEGKWGSSDTYDFSLPEKTFRAPSASTLDRGQSDPAGLDITPRINFVWKRESKFSKDLTCYMTGKSTDSTEKKKSRRDPDIAIALWRNLREMTMYESNLSRIDIEDPKGLEVSLLLSAIVIKDFYFTTAEKLPDLFNIEDINTIRQRAVISPQPTAPPLPQRLASPNDPRRSHAQGPTSAAMPPPPDPRQQWQIDAETARLKAAANAEAREVQRQKREREKTAEAESRRLQKAFEQEQKEAQRRAEEVERETERLKKIYGIDGQALSAGGHPQYEQPPRRSFQGNLQTVPQGIQLGSNGLPYAQQSSYMSGANPAARPIQPPKPNKKKSFLGLRSAGDETDVGRPPNKLAKKQSSMWL